MMQHVLSDRVNVYDALKAFPVKQEQQSACSLPSTSGPSSCTYEGGWCDENIGDCFTSDCISSRDQQHVDDLKQDNHLWSSSSPAAAKITVIRAAEQHYASYESDQQQQQPLRDATWVRACNCADLLTTIRSEQEHEADLHPGGGYLAEAESEACVTPQMRMIVTSWMCEVACEFTLQQETLFLAVELLDRFLAASPGIPRTVLQLVAVSCIFVASKQEEVLHPSVEELTDIAANCFLKEDLLRMEMILLDTLDWRIKSPTAYTFLHLLCQGMTPRLPRHVIATAAYLTELSLLDYTMLPCSPSLVAGAAVLLAQASQGSTSLSWEAMQLLTGHSFGAVRACMHKLLQLQHYAAAAHSHQAYQPLVYVREKFSSDGWLAASVHSAPLSAVPLPPIMS